MHRSEDYDEGNFETLLRMQREHFWYLGRHALVLSALRETDGREAGRAFGGSAVDLGGGCGGWLEYLSEREGARYERLALGDSSGKALALAGRVLSPLVERHQIDLLNLPWTKEWDIVFLLDVLEHIEDHEKVLAEVRRSLKPGGRLILTTPALMQFWTYNDVLAHHRRRYSKRDLEDLAKSTGFRVTRIQYFMFLLSGALYLSRVTRRVPPETSAEEARRIIEATHRVPWKPLNAILQRVLSLERTLMSSWDFPWGTSVLAVFERDEGVPAEDGG